ncbi:hypothetical protein BUALT_Bualt12G0117100 [Buddleja alternifolia]|uniref:RNase H type-1 domain-containing protein n=1 Tax=Buddleja alternifolia TaxID=168488 RepID=A0AAV6WYK5_9LAMI|nr:hypothetical protein BUALT_Bualt12G0117100 [Buddleja alternifolia]
MGVGVVDRDPSGSCVAWSCRRLAFVTSPDHVEALAAVEAIHLARREGWDRVVVEGDCLNIINKLRSSDRDLSPLGAICQEARSFALSFSSLSFSFVKHLSNVVARSLARAAMSKLKSTEDALVSRVRVRVFHTILFGVGDSPERYTSVARSAFLDRVFEFVVGCVLLLQWVLTGSKVLIRGDLRKYYSVNYSGFSRFLPMRRYNFATAQDTFMNAFNPDRGMKVEKLENGRFLFVFSHRVDRDRVLTNRPWNFRNDLIVLKTLTDTEDPNATELDRTDMYVHAHGLPIGKRTRNMAEFIGNRIGISMDADVKGIEQNWGPPLRIRVSMNVTTPLHRFMMLQLPNEVEIKITFAYEKLASFCYLCGKLDHTSDTCELRYAENFVDPVLDTPYRPDLRAPPPRRFSRPTIRPVVSGGSNWWSSIPANVEKGIGVRSVRGLHPALRISLLFQIL